MINRKYCVAIDAQKISIEYSDGIIIEEPMDGVGMQAISDKIMEIDLRHAQMVREVVPG